MAVSPKGESTGELTNAIMIIIMMPHLEVLCAVFGRQSERERERELLFLSLGRKHTQFAETASSNSDSQVSASVAAKGKAADCHAGGRWFRLLFNCLSLKHPNHMIRPIIICRV